MTPLPIPFRRLWTKAFGVPDSSAPPATLLTPWDTAQELKKMLDLGTIGKVYRICQEGLMLGKVDNRPSALWHLAPRRIAVLLQLMGEPPSAVKAQGASFLQPGSHDDIHLELGFSGERSAHIHVSWYWPEPVETVHVFGEKGMIVFDGADQEFILHRKHLAGDLGSDRLALLDFGSYPLGSVSRPWSLDAPPGPDGGRTPRGPMRVEVTRVLEYADFQLRHGT